MHRLTCYHPGAMHDIQSFFVIRKSFSELTPTTHFHDRQLFSSQIEYHNQLTFLYARRRNHLRSPGHYLPMPARHGNTASMNCTRMINTLPDLDSSKRNNRQYAVRWHEATSICYCDDTPPTGCGRMTCAQLGSLQSLHEVYLGSIVSRAFRVELVVMLACQKLSVQGTNPTTPPSQSFNDFLLAHGSSGSGILWGTDAVEPSRVHVDAGLELQDTCTRPTSMIGGRMQ